MTQQITVHAGPTLRWTIERTRHSDGSWTYSGHEICQGETRSVSLGTDHIVLPVPDEFPIFQDKMLNLILKDKWHTLQ